MPQLSMFTPCGMLELTSEPSEGERIYNSIVSALSKAFDMTPGTPQAPNRMEAWAYAMAMMLARASYALQRAGNQARPLTAYDLLPLLEQGYLVVPPPNESVSERAATLAAIDALSGGGRLSDLASGLRQLLGPSLLAIVPMGALLAQNSATPTVYPQYPVLSGGGANFVDPKIEGQYLQTVDPITLGGNTWPVPSGGGLIP